MKKITAEGRHTGLIISTIALFAGLCVFFINVHPIIPFDSDDWLFFSIFRIAVPWPAYWNSARVLQEIVFPLMGMISAFIVKPITNDYLLSFAITIAFVLAFLVSALHVSLYRLLHSVFKNRVVALSGCIMMLVLYFGFFKTRYESVYMLHGLNYTCVVFYTIPGLLNSILVCVLLHFHVKGIDITPANLGYVRFGFLALLSYLAIFSILFESLILTAYCFLYLLYFYLKDKKIDFRKSLFHVCVVAGFLVYCCFEITSGRAAADTINTFGLNASTGFFGRIIISAETSFALLSQTSAIFLVFSVLIAAAAYAVNIAGITKGKRPAFFEYLLLPVIAAAGIYIAILVVSAKAGARFYPQYIQVMYGVFFYFFLCVVLSFCFLLKHCKWTLMLVPFVVLFFSNQLLNAGYRYSDQLHYNWVEGQLPTSKKIELTNNWINIMREADKNGETEVTLYVPRQPDINEFPQPQDHWGSAFSGALFTHKITGNYINVKLEYADGILRRNSFWTE